MQRPPNTDAHAKLKSALSTVPASAESFISPQHEKPHPIGGPCFLAATLQIQGPKPGPLEPPYRAAAALLALCCLRLIPSPSLDSAVRRELIRSVCYSACRFDSTLRPLRMVDQSDIWEEFVGRRPSVRNRLNSAWNVLVH
jgi:hypothetical protein